MGLLWVRAIDAQSFSNSFEGVHGVVKNLGGGLYFCALLHFMLQFFKEFEGVHAVPPSPTPLCASMCKTITDHIN
jgi:hypothetical protein